MRSLRAYCLLGLMTVLLSASPALAQLAGSGAGGQPAAGASAAGDIDGAWGGMMICPGNGRGWALFWDIGALGGQRVGDLRNYRTQRNPEFADVIATDDGGFELRNRSGGWDYAVKIEDGMLTGTSLTDPDCTLWMLPTLGGLDRP
ncbi:MAG: hypothetical protein AAF577_00775 [Pseudomonadota bacterium]